MTEEFANSAGPNQEGPAISEDPVIVVIGSLNMDLIARAGSIPTPGQTVAGHGFATLPGGKGANQAVAAARAGGRVSMIGRIGNDDFGQRLLLGLKGNGVDVSNILVSEGVSTGVAMVIVDDNGENAICISGGANLMLSCADLDEHSNLIAGADVVIMQLEIPQETAAYALQLAHHHGVTVILNPAPAPEELDPTLLEADIIIPNQDETARLCGEPVSDLHSAKLAGSALVARGAKTVVVTLGRHGALAITEDHIAHVPSFNAKMVDSTGAGDAFCGAFAIAYAQHKDLNFATRFAAAAGALACHKFGAQPAMPHLSAITKLLQRKC